MVVSVDRGRYGCVVDGVDGGMVVTAMRARELGRRAVVVGDRVSLVGDVTAAAGTLARIVRVAPRASVLRRSADDIDPVERVVVANADLLVVVTALADPPPRSRLVDRCLVAAYDGGLTPLLCLTKSDLGDAAALTAAVDRPVRSPPRAGRRWRRRPARPGRCRRRCAAARWRGGPLARSGPACRLPRSRRPPARPGRRRRPPAGRAPGPASRSRPFRRRLRRPRSRSGRGPR